MYLSEKARRFHIGIKAEHRKTRGFRLNSGARAPSLQARIKSFANNVQSGTSSSLLTNSRVYPETRAPAQLTANR